jgi:hypothetical protein
LRSVKSISITGFTDPSQLNQPGKIFRGVDTLCDHGNDFVLNVFYRCSIAHGRCILGFTIGRCVKGDIRPYRRYHYRFASKGLVETIQCLAGNQIAYAHIIITHGADIDKIRGNNEKSSLAELIFSGLEKGMQFPQRVTFQKCVSIAGNTQLTLNQRDETGIPGKTAQLKFIGFDPQIQRLLGGLQTICKASPTSL